MPDYNLDNLISKNTDLIEIGFAVDGYEVENIGENTIAIHQNGQEGFGAITGSVPVTIGGYIDDESSKQLVVNWSNHQSIIVTVEGETNGGNYAMCKCDLESKFGLPNILDIDVFQGRKAIILAARDNKFDSWFVGIMATSNMIQNYINHYYTDCGWTEQDIQNLISKHLIYAQVCFASGGSGIYFNTCVVSTPPSNIGDTTITIDSQLFLSLKDIKNEFEVIVTDGTGKSEKVGEKVKPLPTFEYSYEDACIADYNYIYTAFTNSSDQYNGTQYFKKVSVTSSKYQQARVRFFIHNDKKEEVQKLLNDKKIPSGLIGEPTAYYAETISPGFNSGPIPPYDSTKCTLTGNPETDTCFYQPNQSNYQALANAKGPGWAAAASYIEEVCKQLNVNTRMYCTQVVQESGWAFASNAWRKYNNPGGLTWHLPASKMDGEFKGVHIRRSPNKRGEGYGYYMVFDTPRDGIYAMVRLLIDKYRMGAQTVAQHYQNLGNGGYCDKRENPHYAANLKRLYSTVSRFL